MIFFYADCVCVKLVDNPPFPPHPFPSPLLSFCPLCMYIPLLCKFLHFFVLVLSHRLLFKLSFPCCLFFFFLNEVDPWWRWRLELESAYIFPCFDQQSPFFALHVPYVFRSLFLLSSFPFLTSLYHPVLRFDQWKSSSLQPQKTNRSITHITIPPQPTTYIPITIKPPTLLSLYLGILFPPLPRWTRFSICLCLDSPCLCSPPQVLVICLLLTFLAFLYNKGLYIEVFDYFRIEFSLLR